MQMSRQSLLVSTGRGWSVVLERIAADLDNLSLVPNDPHADKESNNHDPQARHRHKLAEPPPKPKKLSHREQRTALRAALGLPPQ
jgi:hypothetical protein